MCIQSVVMLAEKAPDLALMQPRRPKSPVQKHGHAISSVFKTIFDEFSVTHPMDISIMSVVQTYDIQHRRVYDFFNLLTSLGVCHSVVRGRLAWVGVHAVNKTVKDLYVSIEAASIDRSMRSLFCVGPSPSLGAIATRLMCLYIFLGVDTLVLKQISAVLHDPRADKKSLERRMYLVLSFLEVIGVVSHTMKTSEYKLLMDVSEIAEEGMAARQAMAQTRCPYCTEALLSTLPRSYMTSCYRQRRAEFAQFN